MFTPPTPPPPTQTAFTVEGGGAGGGPLQTDSSVKKKIALRIKVFVTAAAPPSQLRLSQPPKSAGIIPAEGGAARATLVR